MFQSIRIFCENIGKKYSVKSQSLHFSKTKNLDLCIKHNVKEMIDVSIQIKLSNIDFVAKEMKCHICRGTYQNKY